MLVGINETIFLFNIYIYIYIYVTRRGLRERTTIWVIGIAKIRAVDLIAGKALKLPFIGPKDMLTLKLIEPRTSAYISRELLLSSRTGIDFWVVGLGLGRGGQNHEFGWAYA